MSDQTRPTDRERLADAAFVIHGPEGAGAVKRVLYGVYVGVILSLTYGFTVVRGVLATSDTGWVRGTLVSWPAAGVVLAAAMVVAVVVHGTGSRRGPVVPPLPWVDHVVAGPVDRAVSLREWWLVAATLVTAATTILGGVLGGALWGAGATGPGALVIGVLAGLAYGAVLALAWLAGQVGPRRTTSGRRDERWRRPAQGLRRLTLEGLRAHSARSAHIGGAVLAGDLRAARLEVATPVRRGRTARLRSHGPVLTIAARDLLGMRRQPGSFVAGLVLVAPAAAGLAWGLVQPQVPAALTIITAAVLYLGAGVWSEGTRLLGDTLGTPRLSGLDVRTEAAAHLVLPAALLLLVGGGAGILVALAHPGASLAAVALWLVISIALLLGMTWVNAFRGRPAMSAFTPNSGPMTLVLWYGRPLLFAALVLGLLSWLAGQRGILGPAVVWLVALTGIAWWWAVRALVRTAAAHRED